MHRERKYKDERLNKAARELGAYTDMRRQIEFFTEKLHECRERYTSVAAVRTDGVKVKGGAYCDKMADIAAQWADLDAEINRLKVRAERELFCILAKLDKLTVMQRRVLEMYYIKGYSVFKIARSLDYSEEWVKSTKCSALRNYAAI